MHLPEQLARVRLIAFDADGVLTDGGLYYGPSGEAIKRFDVKDGHRIVLALQAGLQVAVVSARRSEMVQARMRELGVRDINTGDRDKGRAFVATLARAGVDPTQAVFMGDDLNDLPALRMAGVAACPSDAVQEVKAVCAFVTECPGGRGAVRELVEAVLRAQGKWAF